ncbi:MAG TPA: cytochrome c [Bryobacteraceae bacterium]|nr:cytochrome c [Bryobacteraceae bacterium]
MQNRCQQCHRPGEAAPMSFMTYKDTRPWAKAIREAVITRKMPPWPADPHYGKFSNNRSLPQDEIDTLVAWADGGAREGDPADAPAPARFVDGWSIHKPDVVFEMPNAFSVPASGTIDYQYIVIPSGFTEDKWVQELEARPGNRKVVHHIIAFVRPPGSKWLQEAQPGVPYVPEKQDRKERKKHRKDGDEGPPELLVGFAPGMPPGTLRPGQAKLVKAGSDFVFQMHYTANGTPGTDRSRIGLVFAKEPPTERVYTVGASNDKFEIPAGDSNYEVESDVTFQEPAKLVDMMPHMHLRGKDFSYTAYYPTGESEVLLRVPKYDFSWQLFYYLTEQKVLPAGTRLHCVAHFDNSPNNPANPDATKPVSWGDQSWEEMMIGFFDVAFAPGKDPMDLFKDKEKKPKAGD